MFHRRTDIAQINIYSSLRNILKRYRTNEKTPPSTMLFVRKSIVMPCIRDYDKVKRQDVEIDADNRSGSSIIVNFISNFN